MAKVKGMFQRGSVWWLRYTPAPNAKQERISLETTIEEVATIKAVSILQSAPLEAAAEFEREVDAYIVDRQSHGLLSETFSDTRKKTLLAFARDMGVTRLSDLSVKVVERWLAMLRQGRGEDRPPVKEGTVESYWFSLRAFFRWCVDKNKMRENPALKIQLGKVSRTVKKNFVTADVVQKLIKEAPTDLMRYILYCGFHAGMRRREIVESRPSWFKLGDGERRGNVTVSETPTFKPKDRDERTIPLSREFEVFLRRYMAKLPEDAMFMIKPELRQRKNKYRYDFRRPFTDYMRKQEVKCSPHDMRRTFCSLKLIADSSLIFKVAKWTGDEVRTVQDHYAHLLSDDDDIDTGTKPHSASRNGAPKKNGRNGSKSGNGKAN